MSRSECSKSWQFLMERDFIEFEKHELIGTMKSLCVNERVKRLDKYCTRW